MNNSEKLKYTNILYLCIKYITVSFLTISSFKLFNWSKIASIQKNCCGCTDVSNIFWEGAIVSWSSSGAVIPCGCNLWGGTSGDISKWRFCCHYGSVGHHRQCSGGSTGGVCNNCRTYDCHAAAINCHILSCSICGWSGIAW